MIPLYGRSLDGTGSKREKERETRLFKLAKIMIVTTDKNGQWFMPGTAS